MQFVRLMTANATEIFVNPAAVASIRQGSQARDGDRANCAVLDLCDGARYYVPGLTAVQLVDLLVVVERLPGMVSELVRRKQEGAR